MHLPSARSHSHASKLAANFVDQCFVQCKEKEKERERERAKARAKEKEQEKEREREERETRIEGRKEKRREEEGKNEREQERERERERERRENPPVCTFKTPPCVQSGRPDRTHGGVLIVHIGEFLVLVLVLVVGQVWLGVPWAALRPFEGFLALW